MSFFVNVIFPFFSADVPSCSSSRSSSSSSSPSSSASTLVSASSSLYYHYARSLRFCYRYHHSLSNSIISVFFSSRSNYQSMSRNNKWNSLNYFPYSSPSYSYEMNIISSVSFSESFLLYTMWLDSCNKSVGNKIDLRQKKELDSTKNKTW